MIPRRIVAGTVSAAAVLALLLVALDVSGPLRTVVVVAFLLVGPGAMLIVRAGLDDLVSAYVVLVPVSLCIDGLVAALFVYLEIWNPTQVLAVIALGTLVAGLPELRAISVGLGRDWAGRLRA